MMMSPQADVVSSMKKVLIVLEVFREIIFIFHQT